MRIISLAPATTEILFAVGAGDCIVGRTRYCDHPPDAQNIPIVGGWLDIKKEEIDKLKPDVIMTSTFVQDKLKTEYENKGYKILHVDPITLEQVYDSICTIGKYVGKKNEAEEVVKQMKNDFIAIKPSPGTKIYVEEWHKPPTASGNWVPDILDIIGAKGIAPKGQHSQPVQLEHLQDFNPDAIVLSWCGFGQKAKTEWVKTRPGWNTLRAVKQNKIFVINDSLLNRPGPRLIEGAKYVTSLFPRC